MVRINGKQYSVDEKVPVDTSLNTYIRNYANLKGTKSMCHEGGCGACVVTATAVHPVTLKKVSFAVNSCLIPVFSCHGWEITTVEGIGTKKGYDKVQKTLASFNGTQCGYCSPGMVMNMHSLLESGKDVTMKDVENSFGGNICRCTGYRPILDAFKSLTVDAPPELKNKYLEIEDLDIQKICSRSGKPCYESCSGANGSCPSNQLDISGPLCLKLEDCEWVKVSAIADIFEVFTRIKDKPYMLIAGNTAHGVYRRKDDIEVFIDVNDVKELKSYTDGSDLVLGGNMTLTEAMDLFYKLCHTKDGFNYLKVLADHIDLIANVPVRNTGTIAGNLSIKHQHDEFPSDMFLMLETAGAKLTIAESNSEQVVSPAEFLKVDMKHKIIKSVTLPPYDDSFYMKTYKIMPRAQNAHAYVNAGFRVKLDNGKIGQIVSKPTIVFGGINPDFIHATKTEEYLVGKNLYDTKVLQAALKILDGELKPNHVLPDASPAYRKTLAEGLFYKFVLSMSPESVKQRLRSGGQMLVRPLSEGKQEFDTDKTKWPVNKPLPKLEALVQCSGEATYVNDVLTIPGELYCAFVVTTVGKGRIKGTDASDALSMKGVVAYLDAKDIPGKNNFSPPLTGISSEEEIFCSGNIKHHSQPLGMIVAETQQVAMKAAKLVKVEYESVQQPVLHIRDAIKIPDRFSVYTEIQPTDTKEKSKTKHVIKGSFDIGTQYHYHMETQSCVCIPIEDGLDVYPSSQWMDMVQISISQALNIPENRINIQVRRLGGAYGGKISRNTQVSTACALAAHVLNRPVRFILSLEANMESLGKRFDCALDYEVGFQENGTITYMDTKLYQNNGHVINESALPTTVHHFQNCYDNSTWKLTAYSVMTDVPVNTYCRAPGSTEGIAFIETIMEHIAKTVQKDPIEVKLNNVKKGDNNIPDIVKDLKVSSDYVQRRNAVENFNKENRWRKRGIAVVPMTYPCFYFGNFSAIVSIYAADGTVSVAHGGIESGQGLHTKVAQVCAYTLGIPLELVSVKPSNTLTAPNGMVTGGSITSESCAFATMQCCKKLLERMAPVKEKMDKPTWQQLVAESHKKNVDLCSTYMFTTKDEPKPYMIYGAAVTEVEVDFLTGQQQILRVDLVEDAGQSLNPEVDIGQVEGAFVMGLGYWLMEYMMYDEQTGQPLTNRTWNYKTPGAKDIPIDFRIHLRKNSFNPTGVLRSKATGEPPLCMSVSVLFAIRQAILSARKDAKSSDEWFQMNTPATPEKILLTGLTNYQQFTL